jgi:hypothetical protein
MSTDISASVAKQVAQTTTESQTGTPVWVETTLAVVFAAAAVLFVSFIAVVTGLV